MAGKKPLVWKTVKVQLGKLKPWVRNPRESTQSDADGIGESLDEFGYSEVLLIGPGCELYDGHQRLPVMLQKYGAKHVVECRQSNRALTETERRKLTAFLHAKATGRWNWDALSSWDGKELSDWGFDKGTLKNWKTDVNALDKFLKSEEDGDGLDAEPQIDRAAELAEKWQTKSGQLWKLGNHKLLIGDCTVRENVERLMGGERADCVFTDPPYNVGKNYAGEDLSAEEFEKFHSAWMSEMERVISPDTPVYACFGAKWLFEFTDIFRRIIKKPRLLVWYKPDSHGVGGGDYFYNYEAILYGSISGEFSNRSYEGEARDVWIINKAKESDGGFEHSTVKPIEVPTAALLTSSKAEWVIYEPFCGSGSTLLAAHNLNRRCYAMEISEKYGAVILERFFEATGITPKLEGKTQRKSPK